MDGQLHFEIFPHNITPQEVKLPQVSCSRNFFYLKPEPLLLNAKLSFWDIIKNATTVNNNLAAEETWGDHSFSWWSWKCKGKVHHHDGTMLVCSFLQIIIIIRKLFGETRTALKNERKSRDFLIEKISRFFNRENLEIYCCVWQNVNLEKRKSQEKSRD